MNKGVLDKQYHQNRKKRFDLKYRLNRRTQEIIKAINQHTPTPQNKHVLDMGTADALMLLKLNKHYQFHNKPVGIDVSQQLLNTNQNTQIKLECMDCCNTTYPDKSFDIIIACAVIEHVNQPCKLVSEAHRLLTPGGLIIITTPNPFHDKIAERIGYFKDEDHQETLNIKQVTHLLKQQNFHDIKSKKFMFNPFFKTPLENHIEKVLTKAHITFSFTNQLITAKK